MAFVIGAFIAVFLLVASGGLLLFYRDALMQRISEVTSTRRRERTLMSTIQETGFSIGGVVGHLENVLPKTQAEVSIISQRLIRAGFRSDNAVKIFYGCKVLVPLSLATSALVTGVGQMAPLFVYATSLGIGFLASDFWLGNRIKSRQAKIRRGLPDVLDLLVICIEAGLSLDQATARSSHELMRAQPELCDELRIVVLEQRAGRDRSAAWKHLAERTDVDVVRNLVSMLVQAEQFGTSIAKTLRVHAETLRTQRVQQVEEQAAKTTIKLIFPLVLFIFPSLFVVVLGPAVILMSESFKNLNMGH